MVFLLCGIYHVLNYSTAWKQEALRTQMHLVSVISHYTLCHCSGVGECCVTSLVVPERVASVLSICAR